MNGWAASGKYDCHFICVCVLGDPRAYQLSREMSNEMKLTHCVNGFIDNDADMPTYGQLGCRGFIILDAKHKVVSKSTSAFMEVRGLAFEHVESLLDAVCTQQPLPPFCPGEYVELVEPPTGRPDLRGMQGLCVKVEDDMVSFGFLGGPLRGKMMRLPASSLKKLDTEEAGSEDEAVGGCSQGGCGQGSCSSGACSQGICKPQDCNQAGCNQSSCGQAGCSPAACGQGACKQGACNQAGCNQGSCSQGSCGQGECGNGATTLSELDAAFVAASLDLVSVKVPSMDAEHGKCAVAMQRLAEEGSSRALEGVLTCLADHFKHEEELFENFSFGAHKNERFSAKKTHIEDHHRILDKIRRQLVDCTGGVPVEFVRELLQDFHEHTARYDVQYADLLSEKGAR